MHAFCGQTLHMFPVQSSADHPYVMCHIGADVMCHIDADTMYYLITYLLVPQKCTATQLHTMLSIMGRTFSQRTINEWNRLPGECANATNAINVNMFKSKIDNYFKRSGYV